MPDWFTHPRPLVLGHRGSRATTRENTIASFRLARSEGADGLELDVRHTADEVVVVHHDAETKDGISIPEVKFAELRAEDPEIPTLWETLEATTDLLVNVEIKNDEDSYSLILADNTVAVLGRHRSRVLVSSFDPATVDRVAQIDPDLPRGIITDPSINPMDLIGQVDVHAIHPYHEAIKDVAELMAAAQALAINPWTVNEPDDIKRMAEGGITSIIGDYPARIREIVGD
jgi:glycerophosphoryl diester phosphodiesterase